MLDVCNVDCYISEPIFQLPIDVSSGEANVLVFVHPLLFFGVQMCRSSFLFVMDIRYIGVMGLIVLAISISTRQFREIPNFEWQWLDEMDYTCFVKIELLSYDPETWKTTDYILVGFHFNLLVTMWRPCFQSHKPTKVQSFEFMELTLV
ncbi:hypothetical protein RHMOL_Rhmol05G0301100 [Rhododendron molle]|uniref:Uncharacterized protein n=1 Tax=Rhododendron molle TaxID=49168 RepID=A0ACC0NUP4_RHOML|nr:hypothetical protein RHMOL_Rhmol05G0301100 [Rhododendron molle]